jgi:hypothetical protein
LKKSDVTKFQVTGFIDRLLLLLREQCMANFIIIVITIQALGCYTALWIKFNKFHHDWLGIQDLVVM